VHLSKGLANFDRGGAARGLVGSIDLGEQRREHRRSGRYLHDFQDRPRGLWQVREPVAHVERNRMTWPVALSFRYQVDLEIALLGIAPEVVVPHKAVEVEGAGGSGIELDRGQL